MARLAELPVRRVGGHGAADGRDGCGHRPRYLAATWR